MAINIGENNDKEVTYVNSPDINRVLFKNLSEGASADNIADAVNAWIEEHPEAVTTVQDGSILPVKLDSSNEPSDGYVLSWNATAGKFEWIDIQSDINELKNDLVSALVTNLNDWEQGSIANATGTDSISSKYVRTGFYDINTIYKIEKPIGIQLYWFLYDADKTYIKREGVSTNIAWSGDASNLIKDDSTIKYVRFDASLTNQGATTPQDIVNSDLDISVLESLVSVKSDVSELSSDVSAVNEELYSKYAEYVQGAIGASNGAFVTQSSITRTGLIAIEQLHLVSKPVGIQMRMALYTEESTDSNINVINYSHNTTATESAEDIISSHPTAKFVAYHFQKYENGSAVQTTPEMILAIEPITLTTIGGLKDLPSKVAEITSQYFEFVNTDITASKTFNVPMGSEKFKNMLIKSNAMYEGETAPTIQVGRRWQHPTNGQWLEYFGTPKYTIGGDGTYKIQEWRIPQWIEGYADYVTVYITIPSGTTLHIKNLSNVYDDTIYRNENGIHLNAHGYSGFGGPAQTLYQFEMAAKLGYRYCITIPKVTSDGVYVCLHDDDSIQATARNDDGSTIDSEYQNRPVSDFTYSQLLQFDFGIVRGQPFKGSRIPLLSEFFKICARTGMHPMLSVHPSLSGHWGNIKAMAKKYGVLDTLNIKSDATSIEVPIAVLGNEIESYTIDDSSGESRVARFNTLTTQYNLENVKKVIEYNYSVVTDTLINDVLNNGYVCGVFNIGNDINKQLELIEKGVTEFTEDFNCSVGLNWN